jgi:AcrR family transcriptional regulator
MFEAVANDLKLGSRRERRKLEYRGKILGASIRLFSNKGFDATSIAEIMNEADLGVGTFYNYFTCKEQVISYLANELNQRLEKELLLGLDSKGTPILQITKAFEVLGGILESDKELVKIVYLEMLRQPMSILNMAQQQKGILVILENIVQAGQEQKCFRVDLPARNIARFLVGTYMQTVYNWLASEKGTLTENFSYDLDITLKGIQVS